MKKILTLLLALGMMLAIAACGAPAESESPAPSESPAASESPAVSEEPAESEDPTEEEPTEVEPIELVGTWVTEGDPEGALGAMAFAENGEMAVFTPDGEIAAEGVYNWDGYEGDVDMGDIGFFYSYTDGEYLYTEDPDGTVTTYMMADLPTSGDEEPAVVEGLSLVGTWVTDGDPEGTLGAMAFAENGEMAVFTPDGEVAVEGVYSWDGAAGDIDMGDAGYFYASTDGEYLYTEDTDGNVTAYMMAG